MTDVLLWISGASSGIGAALVETVPYDDVHIIDISRSGGTPGTEHVPADLADPAAWSAIDAHFHARLEHFNGRHVTFVHAAAALQPIGFAGEVDPVAYRRTVLLDASAPLVLGDALLRALEASSFDGTADLVFISSGAAGRPIEGWSAYCAGKAGQDMWVRTVGAEQQRRGKGRRLLAIAPGVVATAMQEQIRATDEHDFPDVGRFHRLHADGQLLDPLDSAHRVWALVTGDAASGAVLDVRDQ
ncbi:MAG TPA: SDR family NAD(P)-dependent oxidoreductase [Euzebyales bacterium]|nr:SDR family NAD(P)-dependent oxidoreductase [Euzebyales bacterium]